MESKDRCARVVQCAPTPILKDLSASCVRSSGVQLKQLAFRHDPNPLDIFPDPDLVSFQRSLKGQMIQRLARVSIQLSELTVINPYTDQQFKRAEII